MAGISLTVQREDRFQSFLGGLLEVKGGVCVDSILEQNFSRSPVPLGSLEPPTDPVARGTNVPGARAGHLPLGS